MMNRMDENVQRADLTADPGNREDPPCRYYF